MENLSSSSVTFSTNTANHRWSFSLTLDFLSWTFGIYIPWQKKLTIGFVLQLGPLQLATQYFSETAIGGDYMAVTV